VATLVASRTGTGFPGVVPQFLQGRPPTETIYACYLDMDIAAPCPPGCPGYNRGLQTSAIVHPLTDEPWGVRRFFVRDPTGVVVNVLGHRSPGDDAGPA
jgi:hypothetical protein